MPFRVVLFGGPGDGLVLDIPGNVPERVVTYPTRRPQAVADFRPDINGLSAVSRLDVLFYDLTDRRSRAGELVYRLRRPDRVGA